MCCGQTRPRPQMMEYKAPIINEYEVEMNKSIGNLNDILVGTEYEKTSACIQKALDMFGVKTIGHLDNAPRVFGKKICGHSTWELVSVIRERTFNPPPLPKPAPPKKVVSRPKPVPTKEEKVIEKVDKIEETLKGKE